MNLKKILLFTAPAALAAFVYLGDAVGISEVVAKTVKQITEIETKGNFISQEDFYEDNPFFKDHSEHRTNGYIYEFQTEMSLPLATNVEESSGGKVACYGKFAITKIKTEIEIEVPDDENVSKVVPAVDPEAETAKKREEAATEVQKAAEKKTEDFKKEITKSVEQAIKSQTSQSGQNNSNAVGTAVIKTDYFTCFTKDMMNLLAANPNMNYEIHYLYKGKRYVIVIPAGTDYSKLQDSNGYYGFRYLDSIFGGYEEGTK